MVKFSANLGFLWADIPLPAAILAAKSAGFDAVECHWPYDTAATEIVKALDDTGLAMLGINTFKGDDKGGGFGLSAVPGQQAAARLAIDQAIFFAAQLGAQAVHVMAGKAAGAGAKTGIAPKRFAEPGYGYSIQYPGDWVVTQSSANTAIFSGKKGTDAFHAIISIQNVKPPEAKTPAQAALRALADLKVSLSREASSVVFVGEQALTYKNENLSLEGRQIIVTYTFAGERYRKWALVVPRPSGTVAHIWSYTAPDSQFRTFRPFADAMLKSWTIRPGDG